MWSEHRDGDRLDHRDESGVALVVAMLAVVIIGGIASVMVARSVAELNLSAEEQSFEATVHIAEAGIDDVIAQVNDDNAFVTADPGTGTLHEFTPGPAATMAEQEAWAVALFEAGACDVAPTPQGTACGIRPYVDVDLDGSVDAGEEQLFMFGVGEDATGEQRAIKIQFDFALIDLDDAIRTNGNLFFDGNSYTIGGSQDSVHTNGDLDRQNCGVDTDGEFTWSGSITSDPSRCSAMGTGDERRIPPISALAYHERYAGENVASWYDMCPDGSVRAPTNPGSPCTGSVIQASGTWRGWKAQAGEWRNTGGSAPQTAGIYYVHHANATLQGNLGAAGNPAQFTVIASAAAPCTDPGRDDGSISFSGGAEVYPLLIADGGAPVQALADRDVSFGGGSSGMLTGFVGAHEQVDLGGNPTINGSVMAEDACTGLPGGRLTTSQSPVTSNTVRGNATVINDGGLEIGGDGIVRVTAWSELFG